jgi:hypothetical protein
VFVVILVVWLVVRNEPFADPNLVIILRIIISLAVAVLGGTIPGFLQIGWKTKGMTIRAGGALALFVLTYLLSPTVLKTHQEDRKSVLTAPTSLLLRVENNGTTITSSDGRQRALFEYTLSNATHGLAIIEDMAVDVLDVIEDKWAPTQALVSTYKYRVTLNSKMRGLVSIAKGFKYSAGEVDRFSLGVSSKKDGFDYFIRIVVRWSDAVTNERRETHSDVMVARLPSLLPDKKLTLNERGARYEQQGELIEARLQAIRAKMSK